MKKLKKMLALLLCLCALLPVLSCAESNEEILQNFVLSLLNCKTNPLSWLWALLQVSGSITARPPLYSRPLTMRRTMTKLAFMLPPRAISS